ncbi:uncharacterized protein MELLADRAFT_108191 [Melampsora larici-populina 98AG31]|uniref:Uncharacterized protein n=1 Tax=Melampsora larici-populina (strain 98AG31 / pathotype 3-4-7) TaxID=747676 RepID=F4RSA1_MELLP|nr:uncharacterized protein MELLADRAFT_108191 [Melampsora larici-populina 98AG31]EGG04728.1 hypothetical protein MELLADRAFT_108191 [Melampsora larici-populina 98AG31]
MSQAESRAIRAQRRALGEELQTNNNNTEASSIDGEDLPPDAEGDISMDSLTTERNEIVTSYLDLAGTRKERRNDLAQRYHFMCDCSLCMNSDPNEVDPREALKCPKCTSWFSLTCQRLAIKKSGQALNPQREPAKAAYYAE